MLIKREENSRLQTYQLQDYEKIVKSENLANLLYNIASGYGVALSPLHLKHLSLKFSCDQDGFYIVADCPNPSCKTRHFYRTPCNSFFCEPCKKYLNARIKRNAKKYLWNCNHFFATFTLPPEIQRLVTSWDKVYKIKISKKKIKSPEEFKDKYIFSEKKIYFVDLVYKAVNSTIKIYCKKYNILSGYIILPHSYGSNNLNWFFHPNVLISSKGFRINPDKKYLNFRFIFGDDYSLFNKRIIDYRFNYNELRTIYEQQLKKVFEVNYIKDTPQIKFADKRIKGIRKKTIYISYKKSIKIILDYFRNIPINMKNIIDLSMGRVTYQTFKARIPNRIPMIDFLNLIMQHIPPYNFRTLRAYDLYSNHNKMSHRYPKSPPKPIKNLECDMCNTEINKDDFVARIQAGNVIWINPLKIDNASKYWLSQKSILDLKDLDKDFEHEILPEFTENGKLITPKKPPPDLIPKNKLKFPSQATENIKRIICESCNRHYSKEDMHNDQTCRFCFNQGHLEREHQIRRVSRWVSARNRDLDFFSDPHLMNFRDKLELAITGSC